jgi:hypothetical protein
MSGRRLGAQGFPLTLSLSKGAQNGFYVFAQRASATLQCLRVADVTPLRLRWRVL